VATPQEIRVVAAALAVALVPRRRDASAGERIGSVLADR
jgi:hypothetical protein